MSNLYLDTRTGELIPICSPHINDPSEDCWRITRHLDKQNPRKNDQNQKCRICASLPHRAYSVTARLPCAEIATKICSATDAYHALSLMDEYIRKPSQYDSAVIERLRTQYKLIDVSFDYEAQQVERGIHEDTTVNELACVIAGELVGWARDRETASRLYHEALYTRGEHFQRCPSDAKIPLGGIAPESSEWSDCYRLQEATI